MSCGEPFVPFPLAYDRTVVNSITRAGSVGIIAALLLSFIVLGCGSPTPPAVQTLPKLTNSLGMTFVRLPGGEFRMGDPEFRAPVHRVRVSPFSIASREVTNRQYERLVPRHRRAKESPRDDDPVTRVTLREAKAFAALLSKREGRSYRLPTDAEWEYAARGGLDGKRFPWGDEASDRLMNTGTGRATKVGSFPPNAFGLYDLVGNAGEWILDGELEFSPFMANSVSLDPLVPSHVKGLALHRGGTFLDSFPFVWFAASSVDDPDPDLFPDVGIRLVLPRESTAEAGLKG
ncbi:hypothetical protein EON79_24030 [bacterium]|nr:MAG: hypothetical protein EON79_24030 [bacterium]